MLKRAPALPSALADGVFPAGEGRFQPENAFFTLG
jgi:hypothetical protein